MALGDAIVLQSLNGMNTQATVEIVGIYVATQEQDAIGMAPSCDRYGNIDFTTHAVYSQLYFAAEDNHYQYGDFFVDDSAELDSFIAEVKSIPSMNWDSCIITQYNTEYQNAKIMLESLQGLTTAIIVVLLSISVVILSLILLMWIRNSTHETGVLLAVVVRVSLQDFLRVCGIGFGVMLLSIEIAFYPIMKLKPKEILSKMS